MSETSKCPKCGALMPADSPEGLCPHCLIALNLATQTEMPGEPGAAKPPPSPPLPVADVAKLFPQMEILECLGRGGMGAVYKARQPRLDRIVALKILSPEKQGNQKFAERFEREARALAKLHHPNIVAVYDFGEVQGNFYLLMEFVDGLTLRQLLQTRKLSPPEALAIVPKICEALQYAHEQGIVHRDIKPENILMDKEGRVKIADFGIAKILGDGGGANLTAEQVIGTPHYMSPEQIEKPQSVDHRADIYSLGVVFYEMLTGELPLGKFAPPSKKVHVDVRLDEIVLRALEKEPERRYQQASEVKTQVETIASSPGGLVPPLPPQKPDHFWRRFAVIVLALIAIPFLTAIVGMLLAMFIPAFVKARERAEAVRQRAIAMQHLPPKSSLATSNDASTGNHPNKEDTYTITSVLQILNPVNPADMNDDFQDVRVLSQDKDSCTVEVTYYPLNQPPISEDPDWRKDDAAMTEYLRPSPAENWDEKMQSDLIAELRLAGIDPDKLTDKQLVEQVSHWAMRRAHSTDAFSIWAVYFPNGKPAVYPPLREAFDRQKPDKTWTDKQMFDQEVLGKSMFYNKVHGSCTSSSVYLATIFRALGIPTRIIFCIPPFDPNDDMQARMFYNNVHYNHAREIVRDALDGVRGFDNHVFNEVYVGHHWVRLNYDKLGQPILDAHYFGLLTHIYTCSDLSEVPLAQTWGMRYFESPDKAGQPDLSSQNPYCLLSVQDHFGANAHMDNPETPELKTVSIIGLYPPGSPEIPAWVGDFSKENADFIIAIKEWIPGIGNQLRTFQRHCPRDFLLTAPQQQKIRVHLTSMDLTAGDGSFQAFGAQIDQEDRDKLIPGVAYSIQPINTSDTYRWTVAPGVTIIPATGLLENSTNSSATGLPDLTDALQKAQDLMNQGQYEDSLQAITNYFELSRFDPTQAGARLFAINDWIELGRRYPKAKEALLELRDTDTQKLLDGEGDFVLFGEVNVINQNLLGNDEASYTLFKAIEQRDAHLASQCYLFVEDQLVAKGEYTTCRKYMGDPELAFQNDCNVYRIGLENQTRMAETRQRTMQQIQENNRQHGWTNVPAFTPLDNSKMLEKMTRDRFVGQVRGLIEILAGTGDKADAKKIQREALAVLDDPRLESAMDDAEENIKNHE